MSKQVRLLHRYIGFFLAGIMFIYAVSGIVLIFRDTPFLKSESVVKKTIEPNIPNQDLGRALRIKGLKIDTEEGNLITFKEGFYNKKTGLTEYKTNELPYILKQMTKLHKATTKSPLFILNILFGVSLLFFVLSSFWMFSPKSKALKKGLYYTLGGVILSVILLLL